MPDKCVVVEDFAPDQNLAKDDQVRREIGKYHNFAIIDRIMRYGVDKNRLMVQLSTEEMAKEIKEKWSADAFGGSTCRSPMKKNSQEQVVGIAKGVPLDVDDEQIKDDILKVYPNSEINRLKKGEAKKPLRTMKIIFANEKALQQATKNGILLECCSIRVRVEKFVYRRTITQCYNCYRFGHMAKVCRSVKLCEHCGNQKEDGDHDLCKQNPKCLNCKGDHSATLRTCPKYLRLFNIINERNDD